MSYTFSIFAISIIFEIFSIIGLVNFPRTSNFFFFLFILSLAVKLSVNIENMQKYLSELNLKLEKKVIQKTYELKSSMQNIQKIKSKEDSLYYRLGNNLIKTVDEIQQLSTLLLKFEKIDDSERLNLLSYIIRNTDELNLSLENLISWAKLQINSVSLKLENINLKDLVLQSIGVHKETAYRKNIKLKIEVEDNLVETDPEILGFILRKLFSNAIKYTPEGGTISFNGSSSKNSINFVIKDTGRGIDENFINKLLKEVDFDDETSIEVPNTNIGMKICNRYISLLEGKISIKSQIGDGTEVNIFVPQKAI